MTNSLDIHRFTVCSPGPPTGPRHLHSASPKTDMSSFRALWIPRVLWVPRVPGSGSWNGELQGAWGYDLSTSSTRRRLMCSPWSRWMWNDVGDMHHNEIRQSKGIKHDITWLKQPIWWGLWGYGIWPYFAARNRWYISSQPGVGPVVGQVVGVILSESDEWCFGDIRWRGPGVGPSNFLADVCSVRSKCMFIITTHLLPENWLFLHNDQNDFFFNWRTSFYVPAKIAPFSFSARGAILWVFWFLSWAIYYLLLP